MDFCFVQNFFFGQYESQNIYFSCRAKHGIFFPEVNRRLSDQNSESDNLFFLHQTQNMFFSATLGIKFFFRKKNIIPPALQVKWSVPKTAQLFFSLLDIPQTISLNLVMLGSVHLNDEENKAVFKSVQIFIVKSKRFTPGHAHIIFFIFSILFNLFVLLF